MFINLIILAGASIILDGTVHFTASSIARLLVLHVDFKKAKKWMETSIKKLISSCTYNFIAFLLLNGFISSYKLQSYFSLSVKEALALRIWYAKKSILIQLT